MKNLFALLVILPLCVNAQTYDVRTYGAKIDGTTNDLAALRAAVAAAVANRGTVAIPAGVMYVDFRGQNPVTLSRNVRINGAGRTSIIRTNRATPTANQALFSVATGDSASFSDLSIIGPDSSGSITTIAIEHRGGANGVLSLSNVYIEGFTDGIKSQEGSTSILATNAELARCGMGILFTGNIPGKVQLSGCTIRDTRPQIRLHAPDLFHGLYIYRQHELRVSGSTFLRITGFGIHLWDGDTSAATPGGVHVISDCVFDSMNTGILSGSKRGRTDQISGCHFTSCGSGIRIQQGDAAITSCEFRSTGAAGFAAVVPQDEYPGNVSIANSTFYLPDRDPAAPAVYLHGNTPAVWKITSCSFWGSGRRQAMGVFNSSATGSVIVRRCQFQGSFASTAGPGAIVNEGGSMTVDSSNFTITGDVCRIVPRTAIMTYNTLNSNTVTQATAFVRVISSSSGASINISGNGNFIGAGEEFVDAGNPARLRNYQLGNRPGFGGSLTASATITLSRSYDTWRIRGRSAIRWIAMAGTYHAYEYGACTIHLIADSSFSLNADGNIVPDSTAPRKAGTVVLLVYDTAAKKWRERHDTTGIPSVPPDEYHLFQNYPNPFNGSTIIEYSLPRAENIALEVFDLLGRHITTLISGSVDAGVHRVQWDATGHASGYYMYRLRTDHSAESKTLLLLR